MISLPFSRSDFFELFGRYNEAVQPAPWVLTALAVLILLAAFRPSSTGSRIASLGLALLWIWMGVVYHWVFFSSINPAAAIFGALFVGQAALLIWWGVVRTKLRFGWPGRWRGVASVIVLSYGLLVYPVLNELLGHQYPETPTFGLPCPTTIFTFGVLCWLRDPFGIIMAVPWIWAVVGGSAAFLLGVPQDLGVLAAGAVSILQFTSRPE